MLCFIHFCFLLSIFLLKMKSKNLKWLLQIKVCNRLKDKLTSNNILLTAQMLPPYYLTVQNLLLACMFLFFVLSIFNYRYSVMAYLFVMLLRPGEAYELLGSIRFEFLSVIYITILTKLLKWAKCLYHFINVLCLLRYIMINIAKKHASY